MPPLISCQPQNPRLIRQALSAACSAGVAANFVSPIGGMLFSVEATSTMFPVRELQWAAISGVTAAFVSRQLESVKRNDFRACRDYSWDIIC